MNRLSVELLRGLLEEAEIPRKEVVGMFGGGFKPPTVGHLEVVKRALDENPEMDKMIVLVGSGERDSITQEESLAIWRIYQKYLPKKVEIQPAPEGKPPIGAIYGYAKDNPDKDVYWFLGARKGNEEDSMDIIKRTKSLQSGNYPNVTVKKILTGGTVSGTKTRKALLARDKETFTQALPDIPEVDQIWNMLSDTMGINEEKNPIITNDKMLAKKGAHVFSNGKKLFLKRRKFYNVKEIVEDRYNLEDKQGRQCWVSKADLDNKWTKYNPEELKKGIEVEKEHTDDPRIAMKIALDHLDEDPQYYTKLATLGLEERVSFNTDFITKDDVEFVDDMADRKLAPVDVDLSGGHFFDRLNDPRNFPDISVEELEDFFDKLSDEKDEFIEFLKKYKDVVVKDTETNINIPFMKMANKAIAKTIMRKKNFMTSNKVLPLEEGRYDREVTIISRMIINFFKANIGKEVEETFEEAGELSDGPYDVELYLFPTDFDTLGPLPFIINAAGDEDAIAIQINYNLDSFPEAYNELIAELKDAIRHELEHTSQGRFNKGVTPDGIDQDDLPLVDYLTLDYEIPAFVQGIYKNAKTKKIPFSKALQNFLDERMDELDPDEEAKVKKIYTAWAKKNLPAAQIKEGLTKEELTPQITSLTQYMNSNGLNLKPYPKVKFIGNDQKNADNLLGKTAYYDPNAKLVVLYTLNRHPKDVLRSYAHELVHHHQNLNGTLQPFQTQNTNEDGDLDTIEREAYENGNILFRNWEDSIKN